MENKIYVGNLPYNISEEDLKTLFESCGEITEVIVAKERFTGKPKGFAFITYLNEKDAQHAIKCINGHSILDRKLTVSIARKKKDSFSQLKPITFLGNCIFCNKREKIFGFNNNHVGFSSFSSLGFS